MGEWLIQYHVYGKNVHCVKYKLRQHGDIRENFIAIIVIENVVPKIIFSFQNLVEKYGVLDENTHSKF